jgi:ABC-type lipoprotein release transport system permease subunit
MTTALRRQLYLIDFTVASLARRKGRQLGLLAVYSAIVFMLASTLLFAQALQREAAIILQGAPEIIVQRMVAGRHALLPEDYLQPVGRLRGVSAQRGRLWGYFYDAALQANYTVMVPAGRELGDDEAIIGRGIARVRGVGIGDYVTLPAHDGGGISFRVGEILSSESELVSADLFLISERAFRKTFGVPDGQFTDLVLSVPNPRERRTIAEKISVGLPDARPILRDEILRTYDAVFAWRQGIVLVLLTGAILAFVIFAWDKAAGLSAEEKREIGILKAVGWETGDVLQMKFWEGAIVSLAAFFLGYLAAYVHVFYASAGLFEPVLKGWAVLYPEFRPIPFIDPLQVATLFLFTVFPYTVATIVPIWRAAITDPDAVMR